MLRLLTLTISLLLCGSLLAQEWGQWGGPMRDFSLPANTVINPWGESGLESVWSAELGDGSSTIVTDGKTLYTIYRTYDGETIGQEEIVAAIDAATGKTKWEYKYAAEVPADRGWQGEKGPNGSPLLYKGMVFTLGFNSDLIALDATTGKKVWSYNLINDFNADVIYFGNACSPIGYGDNVIVMGFGDDAGTYAFNAKSGEIAWKSEKMFNSYSSPIIASIHGTEQLVGVGGKHAWGLSPVTGETLWKHELKNAERTNAPTPMSFPDNQLLIAGQGVAGAMLLQVNKTDDGFSTEEKWHNRKIGLFMGTHVRIDDLVLGGDRRLMFAFNWKTGEILWRKRGFRNPKLVAAGNRALILADDGILTLATFDNEGLNKLAETKLLENRTWTAPTVSGNTLFARDRRVIKAVKLPKEAAAISVQTASVENPDMDFVENLYLAGKTKEAKMAIDNLLAAKAEGADEKWMNNVGRLLIQQDMPSAAVELFKDNRERFPESGYPGYGLREAYNASGNSEMVAKLDKEILVPVTITTTVPASTTAEDKLYLTGNNSWLGNWNPSGVEMTRNDNGTYSAEIMQPRSVEVEYKVTRGNWQTAEKDAEGNDIDNRKLMIDPDVKTVEISVLKWGDK